MSTPNSDLYTRVMSIVNQLPQRAFITDAVAEYWVREVIKLEGERAIWHAHRAGTIGGSEAGEFLLAAMKERPAYNSLDEIWRQKMLLDLPVRPNIHMRRGTFIEPLADQVYLNLTGHVSVLDNREVEAAFQKPHALHAHMGGNPDQVVDANRLRVITDFKVRNNLDEEKGISIVNGAQLHWYGMIHDANLKHKPDGYALAELDIPADMMDDLMRNPPKDWDALARNIAAINRPGFGMQIRYFKHNDALAQNLVRLSKQFWDKYVMTGTPYITPKPQMPKTMPEIERKRVAEAQNKFLVHKLAEKVASEKGAEIRRSIDKMTSKYDLDDWPFQVAGLSSGLTERFSNSRAAKALLAKGVDRGEISKASETPDVERMVQTLESHGLLGDSHYKSEWDQRAVKSKLKEHGLQADDFVDKSLRMSLTRVKAEMPVREHLEQKMGSHLSEFMRDEMKPAAEISVVEETDDDTDQPGLRLA